MRTAALYYSSLLLICWLAAAFRFRALFANHFHADEALFASWARLIGLWRDPLLLTQMVDKPPLLFYLQALFYPVQGHVEWTARLPGFIASILLVPLTAALARRLTGDRLAALAAALLVALSPLAIQFSATAFIDPLLAALLVAALINQTGDHERQRPFVSGLLYGLAVAAKYQAWLFLPLLIGLGALAGWRRSAWGRWLLGLSLILALLLAWMLARGDNAPLLITQWRNIGGLRLAHSWELWPRLRAWVALCPYVAGVVGLALALIPYPLSVIRKQTSFHVSRFTSHALLLFLLAYFLLHWLTALPIWDRYLLPLAPFLAILAGRGLSWLALELRQRRRRPWSAAVVLAALVALLLPAAWDARAGRFAIGGGPAADQGAAQVGAYLAGAPYGTVLYDHWYSWHWRYHFIDKGVYVSWFPGPAALVEDLAVFARPGDRRYLVLPDSPAALPVIRRLNESGFRLEPAFEPDAEPGMILYRIRR